jgi:S-adenosylmethionine/arginine decarboxylase-like enzyme
MRKTRKNSKNSNWGYHLILNAGGCDPVAIRSRETIVSFTKALVKEIDMVAYGKPKVVMFGSGGKKGYTLVQLIETSNITAHFVEATNDVYLDIFSCKAFKIQDAINLFKDVFSPNTIDKTFLKRHT